jgi:hypothetical protein
MSDAPVRYRVASDGTIVWFDERFGAFARENGAPTLADTVLGTPLADYFGGPEVRNLYERLMERVRGERRGIEFPFRCDAPALRRFMRMRVDPAEDGGLWFTAVMERTEARDPVPVALLMTLHRTTDEADIVTVCAWCKRIEGDDGEWREVEEVLARGLLDRDAPIALSHAACPACAADLMALA